MPDSRSKISMGIELCLVIKTQLMEFSKSVNEATHLLLLMNKLIKTGKALKLLVTNDYFEDAFILTRSIFEMVVLFLWIIKEDTQNRIEKHQDFVHFDRYYQIEEYLEHIQSRKVPIDTDQEKQKFIDDAIREYLLYAKEDIKITDLLNKYMLEKVDIGKCKRKLLPSIRKMAKEVGMDQQYLSSYWFDSAFVHSGANSLYNYEEKTTNNRTFLESQILNDFLYFIYCLSYWTNKKFHFGLDHSISRIKILTLQAMRDHYKIE